MNIRAFLKVNAYEYFTKKSYLAKAHGFNYTARCYSAGRFTAFSGSSISQDQKQYEQA